MRNSRFLTSVGVGAVISGLILSSADILWAGLALLVAAIICDSIEKIGAKGEPTRRSTD